MENKNIVFLGHVDSGKSSLCGAILLACGMVDQRTFEKCEKEAEQKAGKGWGKAFLLDTNEEERRRGKTIEVAREIFIWKNKRYTILDAPGHKNYVPNAIEGIVDADIGILVVSARKGEAENFSKEHAVLAGAFGISRIIVFVNKMDDQSVLWSGEKYQEIVGTVGRFLKRVGFGQKNISFVPGSALLSQNIDESFNERKCFLDVLDGIVLPQKPTNSPTKILVISRTKDQGKLVIYGRIESGKAKIGQELFVSPTKKKTRILSLFSDFETSDEFQCGENIFIVLEDIEEEDIKPSFVLCEPSAYISPAKKIEAMVKILCLSQSKPVFSTGYECVLQSQHLSEHCVVEKIVGVLEKEKTKKSLIVKKGETAKVVLMLPQRSVCLEPFDVCKKLGRFVLRDQEHTVGIGKILRTR